MSTLKDKSTGAAVSLRARANLRTFRTRNDVPMLAIPGDALTKAVLNCWFQDSSNIHQVEAQTGESLSKTLRSRGVEW